VGIRALVFVLATLAAMVLIGRFARPLRAPGTSDSGNTLSLEAAIREIDAGRQSSPLVGEQPRRGKPSVTFLAKRDGNDAPRIVSDATGWGERQDGTFDYSAGKMAPVGQTGWYSLETKVEPYARIEYLIAYGTGDYRLDPHNPRKVQRANGPASEFVMPGYMPPQEFVDPPIRPAGDVAEAVVESRVLKDARRVIVYTPPAAIRWPSFTTARSSSIPARRRVCSIGSFPIGPSSRSWRCSWIRSRARPTIAGARRCGRSSPTSCCRGLPRITA
jgi:hypothetical protein